MKTGFIFFFIVLFSLSFKTFSSTNKFSEQIPDKAKAFQCKYLFSENGSCLNTTQEINAVSDDEEENDESQFAVSSEIISIPYKAGAVSKAESAQKDSRHSSALFIRFQNLRL